LTIILTDGPYISQYADMAYKIASRALNVFQLNIFLYLDAVHIPKSGQNPSQFKNTGRLIQEMSDRGAVVRASARGYQAEEDGSCPDYLQGIKITSLYDLAEMLEKSDLVIAL